MPVEWGGKVRDRIATKCCMASFVATKQHRNSAMRSQRILVVNSGIVLSPSTSAAMPQNAMSSIDQLLSELTSIKKKSSGSYCDAIIGHLQNSGIDTSTFNGLFATHRMVDKFNTEILNNQASIATEADVLKNKIRELIAGAAGTAEVAVRTADSPLPVTTRDPRALMKIEDIAKLDWPMSGLRRKGASSGFHSLLRASGPVKSAKPSSANAPTSSATVCRIPMTLITSAASFLCRHAVCSIK